MKLRDMRRRKQGTAGNSVALMAAHAVRRMAHLQLQGLPWREVAISHLATLIALRNRAVVTKAKMEAPARSFQAQSRLQAL